MASGPSARCVKGTAFVLLRADGAMLLRRRPPTGLLGGMIDLPATPWETGAAPDDLAGHAPGPAAWRLLPGTVRHVFTHFALELQVARGELDGQAPAGLWARPERARWAGSADARAEGAGPCGTALGEKHGS